MITFKIESLKEILKCPREKAYPVITVGIPKRRYAQQAGPTDHGTLYIISKSIV
jgi:hypothetical protein